MLSNAAVIHDVLVDYICVEAPKGYCEALQPAIFYSFRRYCDQANFVENPIAHAR